MHRKYPVWLIPMLLLVTGVSAATVSPQRQAELRHLVKQDCGSCHGLTLKGGLGPPITPEAMADKSREAMLATLLQGRPGTPMPPWSDMLSYEEAVWIIDLLYRGVGKE